MNTIAAAYEPSGSSCMISWYLVGTSSRITPALLMHVLQNCYHHDAPVIFPCQTCQYENKSQRGSYAPNKKDITASSRKASSTTHNLETNPKTPCKPLRPTAECPSVPEESTNRQTTINYTTTAHSVTFPIV